MIFIVHARGTPEVLSRIVLLLHRRRVPVVSLKAEFDNQTDTLRLEVQIENEAGAELIEANFYKLWDVMLVEKKSVDCDTEPYLKRDGERER